MKPIKTIRIRPDLLPRRGSCGGGASCPTKRTAGFDEMADTLVLPPSCLGTCLATSPSAASETCASQAACTRASGSSGSIGALMLWRPSAGVGPFVLTGVSFSALLALALRNEASRLFLQYSGASPDPAAAQCVSQHKGHKGGE